MFNLGGGEALVIALIALIVLGPSRLPEAARTVGKVVGEVRRLSTGFQSEVRDAFKDAEADTPSSKATARRRESAPLAAAVEELNSSSDARDDLVPEPVEAAEAARPATTMAEADRGPSATAVPPPGANGSTNGNGNANGHHAADEVAPEVAEALDQILADPAPAPAPAPAAADPPAAPSGPPASGSAPSGPAPGSEPAARPTPSPPPEADTTP
ncbi:MAG TPA: Sec-independent protein translocase protein TatB [Acidimicrobiales bacterium]|nr:Sec-independent protein translocase protein TatB [Acidimicrobiales bacterium]